LGTVGDKNASIRINLSLKASSEDGIKKDTLDLKILESLDQRGMKWKFNKKIFLSRLA